MYSDVAAMVNRTGHYFWYQGRSDDMLKAGGVWVSPVEVEATLMLHPTVPECAVIGLMDKDELVKPKVFVVPKQGHTGTPQLECELQTGARTRSSS